MINIIKLGVDIVIIIGIICFAYWLIKWACNFKITIKINNLVSDREDFSVNNGYGGPLVNRSNNQEDDDVSFHNHSALKDYENYAYKDMKFLAISAYLYAMDKNETLALTTLRSLKSLVETFITEQEQYQEGCNYQKKVFLDPTDPTYF